MEPDELLFFDRDPAALELYEALRRAVSAVEPEAQVRVQKTQISFGNPRLFAAVSFLPVRKKARRPEHFITVTLGLPCRLDSPRVDAASEPYPNRWTHHLMVSSPEEIDGELRAWIGEAAAFARAKGKR